MTFLLLFSRGLESCPWKLGIRYFQKPNIPSVFFSKLKENSSPNHWFGTLQPNVHLNVPSKCPRTSFSTLFFIFQYIYIYITHFLNPEIGQQRDSGYYGIRIFFSENISSDCRYVILSQYASPTRIRVSILEVSVIQDSKSSAVAPTWQQWSSWSRCSTHTCGGNWEKNPNTIWCWSAADVKREKTVLVWSLKSSISSSTSFQMDKTVWGVVSAAVEQSRRKASMVAQGDGKFGPWGWPQDPSKPKKSIWCCFWLHNICSGGHQNFWGFTNYETGPKQLKERRQKKHKTTGTVLKSRSNEQNKIIRRGFEQITALGV